MRHIAHKGLHPARAEDSPRARAPWLVQCGQIASGGLGGCQLEDAEGEEDEEDEDEGDHVRLQVAKVDRREEGEQDDEEDDEDLLVAYSRRSNESRLVFP